MLGVRTRVDKQGQGAQRGDSASHWSMQEEKADN